jgi:hypothetical protein
MFYVGLNIPLDLGRSYSNGGRIYPSNGWQFMLWNFLCTKVGVWEVFTCARIGFEMWISVMYLKNGYEWCNQI